MRGFLKYILIETGLFLVMGIITLIEITSNSLFESFFTLIKSPSSWFVGLSLAYIFSSLMQGGLFSIFSKKRIEKGKEKGDFFAGFIITLIITSLITPYVYKGASYLFSNFFIYFHIILLQSVVLLYLLFKVRGRYEISTKYFLTTELIVLIYALIVLSYIA